MTKNQLERITTAAKSLREYLDGTWQGHEGIEAIAESLEAAADPAEPTAIEQAFIDAAQDKYDREGEIEIDDEATVSISDDNGAYVQAWVFVRDTDTDLPCCEECACRLEDGKCPECGEEADEEDEEAGGDDVCDLCMSSEVSVERTTWCSKTIGVECGCEATCDGTCGNDDCIDCATGKANEDK